MVNIGPRPLYGVVIRDVISRGNLDEMRAFQLVSAKLLKEAGDLEGDEATQWKAAQQELSTAIADHSRIDLTPDSVVAIRDGIVVIDSIELAKALKPALESDLEPRITISW